MKRHRTTVIVLLALAATSCGSRVKVVTSPTAAPTDSGSASPSSEPDTSSPTSMAPVPGSSASSSAPGPTTTPTTFPTGRPLKAIGSSPGLRVGAAAVPAAGGVLVYGGQPPNGGTGLHDTWSWDGRSWREVTSTGPTSQVGTALGTDPSNSQPLLLVSGPYQHEGSTMAASANQTWRWTSTGWQQAHPTHALVNGQVMSTVPDPLHHRLLAWMQTTVGDISKGSANALASSEMWAWDGNDWTRLYAHAADSHTATPTYAVPGPNGSVLGVGMGTYQWTGSGWSTLAAGGGPSSVNGVAYDPTRHLVIAIGKTDQGSSISDAGISDDGTYLFDGKRWTRGPLPAALASRQGPITVWDPADRAVMFGYGEESVGNTARKPAGYGDSWVFTTSGWQRLTT